MLVEKTRIRDKYSTITSVQVNSSATTKVKVLEASYPQTLRVRQLNWAGRSGTGVTTSAQVGWALVAVREGETASSLTIPAFSTSDDYYVPAERVIFQYMDCWLDSNAGTGPGGSEGFWEGDGTLIHLKEGDSVWLTAISTDPSNCQYHVMTLLDIL